MLVLRFMVASDDHQPRNALQHLFEQVMLQESKNGLHSVFSLIIRDWLRPILTQCGFRWVEEIVTARASPQRSGQTRNPILICSCYRFRSNV
jgi:hypothetical protein